MFDTFNCPGKTGAFGPDLSISEAKLLHIASKRRYAWKRGRPIRDLPSTIDLLFSFVVLTSQIIKVFEKVVRNSIAQFLEDLMMVNMAFVLEGHVLASS